MTTDQTPTTAPHGSPNFTPGAHTSCWTAAEHAAYLRGDHDSVFAVHPECKDGHARIVQPQIVDPRNG